MPSGKLMDNPFADLFFYGTHPFPPEIEGLAREIALFEARPLLLAMLQRLKENGGRS